MRKIAVILFGWFACQWGQPLLAASLPGKPIYTNKTRFRIPYNYDAAEMQRLGAREIRLFVSLDHGTQWQQVQAVTPEAGRFSFQAPGDGDYWFSVRTVDAQNRLHPSDADVQPGLQVIVDTTPPKLELLLRQTAPGRVQLSWNALDEHLDPTKLRLEFIQQGAPNWQAVGVIPKASGQTEWSAAQGGTVAVRGTISDAAGNVGQMQAQLTVAPANGSGAKPAVPDLREPIARSDVQPLHSPEMSTPEQYPSALQIPRDGGPEILPNPPISPAAPSKSLSENVAAPRLTGNFVSMRQGEFPSAANSESGPREPVKPLTRPDGKVRVVNSRRIQIGYKVQDVGPSGVGSVELYVTQNDGGSWFKYGDDADRQSPFQIEVPQEGIYGFALLVQSGVGLSADPPQAGQKPSIVVVVDETAPQVELLPLEQGRGGAFNKLLIRWKTQEAFPAEKPVSLAFSADRNGTWHPISSDLEDTGSYVWTLGPGVPAQFYLRIEVRDAAGNVQRVETPQPVLVDLSRPTARIVDIETTASPAAPH